MVGQQGIRLIGGYAVFQVDPPLLCEVNGCVGLTDAEVLELVRFLNGALYGGAGWRQPNRLYLPYYDLEGGASDA